MNTGKVINNKDYIAIMALFVISFALYFNSLAVPFLFDDLHMIVDNAFIKHLSGIGTFFSTPKITSALIAKGMYRPLLMSSFSLNYYFNGLNPVGYHIINILLHFLNATLVFFILKLFFKNNSFWPAFLSALFFLVHPVYTEAVVYISCRSTLLSSLFFLLSFFLYIYKDKEGIVEPIRRKLYLGSIFAYLSGLLTKEVVIVLPLVLLIYDFIFVADCRLKHFWTLIRRYHLAFLILSIFYLLWRKYLFGAFGTIYPMRSTYENILSQLKASIFYIKLYLLPVNLCIGRSIATSRSVFEPVVLISLLVTIILLSAAIFNCRKRKLLAFAIFWFFVALLPKFIGSLGLLAAEHQLYLPSVALIIVLAVLIKMIMSFFEQHASYRRLKLLLIILFALILAWYSQLTINRNAIWQDEYTLWADNVKKSPVSWGAYNNLGLAAFGMGKAEEAKAYLLKALESVELRYDTKQNKAMLYNNLANVYLSEGDLSLAEKTLLKSLDLNPESAEAHINLGVIYGKRNYFDKEIAEYKKALSISPASFLAYRNLGVVYMLVGKKQDSIDALKQALSVNPDCLGCYSILESAYEISGRFNDAIGTYNTLIETKIKRGKGFGVDLSLAKDYYNLGILLGKLGDIRAIEAFKNALKIDPEFAAVHNNLAISYANLNPPNPELAKKHALLALKYGYKVRPEFLSQLGIKK